MTFIITFFVLYFIVLQILKRVCNNIPVFIKQSKLPGPRILLLATVHGNEPAGSEALLELIQLLKSQPLQSGSITILPTMNPCGKKLRMRYQPQQILQLRSIDLNRNFGKRPEEEGKCELSKSLQKHVLQQPYDLIVDLHEGWGFRQIQQDSMGSGIYPSNHILSKQLSDIACQQLNQHILQPQKKFVVEQIPLQEGSFRHFCDLHNMPYILIETSGQNDIQPLQTRKDQHLFLILQMLKQLQVLPSS